MSIAGQALERFDAHAWAYCLMGNHYHVVLRTREANLSRLMRHINGVYTQTFNRRHQLTGHLFQGRFKAILVDSDSYLLQVCRYVDLNPVRAQMVDRPDAYRWSSYRALAGLADRPDWLDVHSVHEQLAPGKSAADAQAKYAQFVSEGKGIKLWDDHLKQQIYLGDDEFIARMQKHAGLDAQSANMPGVRRKANVSKIQSSAPALDSDIRHYAAIKNESKTERNQNIANAFYQGGHTQTGIALAFEVSSSTVSRVIKEFENGGVNMRFVGSEWEMGDLTLYFEKIKSLLTCIENKDAKGAQKIATKHVLNAELAALGVFKQQMSSQKTQPT